MTEPETMVVIAAERLSYAIRGMGPNGLHLRRRPEQQLRDTVRAALAVKRAVADYHKEGER